MPIELSSSRGSRHSRAGVHERLAAENRSLQRRVRELELAARVDPLTDLLNRSAVVEAFEREAARARRDGAPLCIALLDVDGFESFNAAHGHTAGDELLRETAQAWRGALRLEDQLARVGSDEFAALLPRCSAGEASAVMTRLADRVPSGQSVDWGVTAYRAGESSHEAWERADRALTEDRASRRHTCFRCNLAVLGARTTAPGECPGCGAALQRRRRSHVGLKARELLWHDPAWTPWTA